VQRLSKPSILLLLALSIGLAGYGGIAHSSNQDSAASTLDSSDATGVAKPAGPTLVGRAVCKECHEGNFQLHSKHGHATTFRLVSDSDLVAKLDGKQFDAGENYGTYHYSADSNNNLFVTLPSRFGDKPFPLQYVLGSGLHAETMLTLVPAPDGQADVADPTNANAQTEGIEHRVSCYNGDRLALTPAHSAKSPRTALEFFGDASTGEPLQRCVYCHTTQGTVAGDAVQDLVANVNCEKCHGPGSEHVRLARMDSKPPPYSIGKVTWDAESELQLCGDCHRLPRSVTEKEIREYPDLLARFQPVGLLRSRCYLDSNRELKCTTCHNPHQSVREMKAADHVRDCLACHQPETETHVACPVEPTTGCIECHMPAIEMDQGLRFHDHWIRVREE